MEKRITPPEGAGPALLKGSDLPSDYLKMVNEVFTAHYKEALDRLPSLGKKGSRFEASGKIFGDEIVVAVSLVHEGELAATTIYASVDFDPKASAPTIQDLLSFCVDALGGVLEPWMDPKTPEKLAQFAGETLSELEEAPFEWTSVAVEKRKIFVKIDKANPSIDALTEKWLSENDPDFQKRMEEEARATEKLFKTGGTPDSETKH